MDSGSVNELVHRLLDEETLFLLVGGLCFIVFAIAGTIGSTIKSVAKERTRREIAAYIAEGSMTPDQGERLLKANKKEGCC